MYKIYKEKLIIFFQKLKYVFSKIIQYFTTFVKCITKYYRLNRLINIVNFTGV